ncbi:hypothetical protein HGRIS_009591 [Hohenbuehelia grisea]|uniref:Uncharacterized protein n=1 Tax=Hohenbuehelia grisea TaxID=104357 RepID=A0ABR3J1U7_9AGAR
MFSASLRSPIVAAANASRRAKALNCVYQTTRGVRKRPWAGGWHVDPLVRDERLLKKLEDQLARVKKKIAREEEDDERLAKQHQFFDESSSDMSDETMLQTQNDYFWNEVITARDRELLAEHDIHSLAKLFEIGTATDEAMSMPSPPRLEELDRGVQVAYGIYTSIPSKIADAQRRKHHKSMWW